MALIECPECGKQISDKAQACPNCGCPINVTIVQPQLNESNKNEDKVGEKKSLFDYAIVLIILCVILPPIGIIFLWARKRPRKIGVRLIISLLIMIIFGFFVISGYSYYRQYMLDKEFVENGEEYDPENLILYEDVDIYQFDRERKRIDSSKTFPLEFGETTFYVPACFTPNADGNYYVEEGNSRCSLRIERVDESIDDSSFKYSEYSPSFIRGIKKGFLDSGARNFGQGIYKPNHMQRDVLMDDFTFEMKSPTGKYVEYWTTMYLVNDRASGNMILILYMESLESEFTYHDEVTGMLWGRESKTQNDFDKLCDDFTAWYERYCDVINRYKNNPYSAGIVREYNSLLTELRVLYDDLNKIDSSKLSIESQERYATMISDIQKALLKTIN